MANDEKSARRASYLELEGWSDVTGWFLLAPFALVIALADHDVDLLRLGFIPLVLGYGIAAAVLIWRAPRRSPPRERPVRAAILACGLVPLWLLVLWRGDPLSFDGLAVILSALLLAMLAAIGVAVIARGPREPLGRRRLILSGAAIFAALLATYGFVLAATMLPLPPGVTPAVARNPAFAGALLFLFPIALPIGWVVAWMIAAAKAPPPLEVSPS
jgi:hypothetical protein